MLNPIAFLIYQILGFYTWIIVAAVIVSWLTVFNVINQHNNFVRSLMRMLYALTEPVFRPVRKVIPPMGGLDLSPMVLLIALQLLKGLFV